MNQSLLISSSTPFLSARKPSPPVGGKVLSRNDKGAANDSFPSHAFFPKSQLSPPPTLPPAFPLPSPRYPSETTYTPVSQINSSPSHPFKTVTKPTKSSYISTILLQISEISPSPIILHGNPQQLQNSFFPLPVSLFQYLHLKIPWCCPYTPFSLSSNNIRYSRSPFNPQTYKTLLFPTPNGI